MNTIDIARKIENPNLCTLNDKSDLDALAKKYPYAQTFSILLLKTLGQNKDLHFEEVLSQHAYRISDRMHLYYLLHENDTSDEAFIQSVEETVLNSETSENESILNETEHLETPNFFNDSHFEKAEEIEFEPVVLSNEVEKENVKIDAFLEEKSLVGTEETLSNSDEVTEEKTLEKEAEVNLESVSEGSDLHEKQNVEIEIEDETNEEIVAIPMEHFKEEETEKFSNDVEEVDSSFSEGISIEFFDPSADLFAWPMEEEIKILSPSSFEQEKKTISLEWIEKSFDPEKDEFTSQAISQGFHTALEKNSKEENEAKLVGKSTSNSTELIQKFEQLDSAGKQSFFSWLHANEKPFLVEKEIPKTVRTEEIIEKFIKEEPKISRSVKSEQVEITDEKKKTPFFKATEKAKESIEDSVIPVSSTLAKIFEAQGNYPKAIHSYEQLMLLYPEKKTFFANQIKELQKKLNN